MSDQLDMFGTPENPANPMEAAFWKFHRENPHVYTLFDRFTRRAIAAGRTRLASKLICERIRWETAVETRGEEFKINNNHMPYYARLWMRNNPRYAGFFGTRTTSAGPISDALAEREAA